MLVSGLFVFGPEWGWRPLGNKGFVRLGVFFEEKERERQTPVEDFFQALPGGSWVEGDASLEGRDYEANVSRIVWCGQF